MQKSINRELPVHATVSLPRLTSLWRLRRSLLSAATVAVPLCASFASSTQAAVEQASDGAANSHFGFGSQSGTLALVGAYGATVGSNSAQGAAYVFRNLDTATGALTQNVKLTASDGAANNYFGAAVSQSGTLGLVGALGATVGGNFVQGAAYVFRNLNTAAGGVTQDVKLTASDGASYDNFGNAVSESGTLGLVGASGATVVGDSFQGAAYVFRNLDAATGGVTQDVKLIASDGEGGDNFGNAVSQSGTLGLVGAYGATVRSKNSQGAAYVFRNLDTATGTVEQDVKLTASDGAANNYFGLAVSQSGTLALVGAEGAMVGNNSNQGAAYVFRNLDTAPGGVTQNVKLTASDGAGGDNFGCAVSQSGTLGLVGAYEAAVGGNSNQGAAYLFRNLDTATGTVTQDVKLTASDGAANNYFGTAVSLDGDQFIIGADGFAGNFGKSYSGSIASITTLDTGNTTKVISGISFVSQDSWIIGNTTSGNQVTLGLGDSANVPALYIGKTIGLSNNKLLVRGTVTTNSLSIGSGTGNTLEIANDGGTTTAGTVSATTITVNSNAILLLSGSNTVSDRIANATAISLRGGTFNLNGLSEGSAGTAGVGNFALTSTSTIDFGATPGPNLVQFAGLGGHTTGTTLQILDWEGKPNTPNGTDRLLFSGMLSTFTTSYPQGNVSFDGVTGYVGTQYGSGGSSYYEISQAPEPTVLTLLCLPAVALLRRNRRVI